MSRQSRSPILVIAALCVFQIAAVLAYLLRSGRLSIVPIYDDVVYLIDGIDRLAVLDRAGLWGLLGSFGSSVAHSPISSLFSGIGFLISGGAVWGPYLMNGTWLLTAVALAALVLRDLSPWSRAGVLVALLAAPMFGFAIAEFRPDVGWGLLVGFSAALMASYDFRRVAPVTAFWLGALTGLAILAKPSASPAAIVVLGIAFVSQFCVAVFEARQTSLAPVFRRSGVIVAGALVVLLPYVVTSGSHVISYILTVMGNERAVWETNTSVLGHLTYYLNRGTGPVMLGWFWFFGPVILVMYGALLIWKRNWLELLRFAGLLCALLAAYLIPSISTVKSLLIGSLVYGCIIAAVIYATAAILRTLPVPSALVVAIGAALYVYGWTPRAGMIHREDPSMAAIDVANRAILPSVVEKLKLFPTAAGTPTVLISVPGPAFAGTLDFLTRQQGTKGRFIAAYTWSTWTMFADAVAGAQIVIACEPGMAGQALGFSFPSVQFQEKLIQTLRADAAFTGEPAFTDPSGKSVWIFVRRS